MQQFSAHLVVLRASCSVQWAPKLATRQHNQLASGASLCHRLVCMHCNFTHCENGVRIDASAERCTLSLSSSQQRPNMIFVLTAFPADGSTQSSQCLHPHACVYPLSSPAPLAAVARCSLFCRLARVGRDGRLQQRGGMPGVFMLHRTFRYSGPHAFSAMMLSVVIVN